MVQQNEGVNQKGETFRKWRIQYSQNREGMRRHLRTCPGQQPVPTGKLGVRPPGKKGQKILSFHAHHYTMSEHQRLTERFLELLGWGWGIGQTYIKELDV